MSDRTSRRSASIRKSEIPSSTSRARRVASITGWLLATPARCISLNACTESMAYVVCVGSTPWNSAVT